MHRCISVTCQVVSLTLQCMSVCPYVCLVLCEFVLSKDVFDKDNKDSGSSLSFQERSRLLITALCCAPGEIQCPGKACVRAFAVSCIKIYPIDFSRKGC